MKRAIVVLGIFWFSAVAHWSVADEAPAPGALEIGVVNSMVSISWPAPAPGNGFIVEFRETLASGAVWRPVPAAVWPVPGMTWTDPRLARRGASFYRLIAQPSTGVRGRVLSTAELPPLSRAQIQAMYDEVGVLISAGVGVRLHRIVYETVNPFELPTTASGLLVLPESSSKALPLVSYQHGTIVRKDETPSAMEGLEALIGVAFGSSGYAAVVPDYVGLGESPGLHPFVHAKSEAAAVIDMLRAARVFCASNSVALNGQLFLIGYSQGGHATMAAHREIEAFHTNEFTITASAPMAGPYDLSGVMVNDFLSDRAMPNPYYFLYLLASYQSVYGFAESLAELLAPPYDETLPPLLDGRHGSSELNHAIGTSVPVRILKQEFLDAFEADPNHPLRIALRENDVYDWTPIAPMQLYHCGGDEDVLYANSQSAYDSFMQRGATQVKLLNPLPLAGHGTCAPVALLAAKLVWFDTLVAD
jgi:hypothetical protein